MRYATIVLALLATLASTASFGAEGAARPDTSSHAPAEHPYSYAYDIVDNDLIRPATRMLDMAWIARKATSHPREAANVDDQDQVRLPSTWWQPRIGLRPVSVEQMMSGPGPGTGPAPGRWEVSHGKDQGVTPGFQVKDSKGTKFFIKFDPPGFPDLATSAEVIGSRLFWAAGYNVPDVAIAYFRAEDLDIAAAATYADAHGRKHPITQAYLTKILSQVEREGDGRYRCNASPFLKGKPLGPFAYRGRVKDDPEDGIPHELRRELRGLWTICAWVNHADSRGPNSLDMWVTDNGRSFVRHHLIDFNAILGASAIGPRVYPTGTEYYVDFGVMAEAFATVGLKPFAWEPSVDPHLPSVGFIEAETFDPAGWRPDYPNPAFDQRTERDIRWGARIVAGFTDAHIHAAVAAARYSDPHAADYITRILIERRDKLVRRWLGQVVPPSAIVAR